MMHDHKCLDLTSATETLSRRWIVPFPPGFSSAHGCWERKKPPSSEPSLILVLQVCGQK